MAAWRACQALILWLDIGSLDDLGLISQVCVTHVEYLSYSFVLMSKQWGFPST